MNKYLFLTDNEEFVQDIINSYNRLPSSFRIDIVSTNKIKKEALCNRGEYSLIYVDKQIISDLFKNDLNNQTHILNGFVNILYSLIKLDKRNIIVK